jgi:hypothetical protein
MVYQRLLNSSATKFLISTLFALLVAACSSVENFPCSDQGADSETCTVPGPTPLSDPVADPVSDPVTVPDPVPAPVNLAPTTTPVTLSAIVENSGARVITQSELLAQANDPDGDALSVTELVNLGAGTLVNHLDGTWEYTPAHNDDTSVNFSYKVTDGVLSVTGTASMDITPPPDPADINLSWVAPSTREDNTPIALSEITGYHIYYGTAPDDYTNQVDIDDGSAVQKTLTGLPSGTYYIVITTIDIDGRESLFSDVTTINI